MSADTFVNYFCRMTAEHWADIGLIIHEDPSTFATRSGRGPVRPNAHRPEHGGVGDPAYLRRLAARGERDES